MEASMKAVEQYDKFHMVPPLVVYSQYILRCPEIPDAQKEITGLWYVEKRYICSITTICCGTLKKKNTSSVGW
jgi:hypothetical protein